MLQVFFDNLAHSKKVTQHLDQLEGGKICKVLAVFLCSVNKVKIVLFSIEAECMLWSQSTCKIMLLFFYKSFSLILTLQIDFTSGIFVVEL